MIYLVLIWVAAFALLGLGVMGAAGAWNDRAAEGRGRKVAVLVLPVVEGGVTVALMFITPYFVLALPLVPVAAVAFAVRHGARSREALTLGLGATAMTVFSGLAWYVVLGFSYCAISHECFN